MPTTTTPDPETTEPDDDVATSLPSNWEFIETIPTPEAVKALLETLPDQWGVHVADFAEFIQALPSTKKVKVEVPSDGRRKSQPIDKWFKVWTLYMGVAGRIAMLRAAAEINHWRVDMEPAPGAGGVGGFIEITPIDQLTGDGRQGRIVYREAITIWTTDEDEQECLGTKTGTAWVPAQGGQQAAGSNPWEKCETAARGRAIAAWGIGILPGSGVASVEEMQNADQINRQREQGGPRQEQAPRKTREQLIDEALGLAEQCRQLRGEDTPIAERIIVFGKKQAIAQDIVEGVEPEVDWSLWNDGKITLLVSALTQTKTTLTADQSGV